MKRDDVQAAIDTLQKNSKPTLVRSVMNTTLWFALPFLVLWGAGVPIEYAVRVAVCPMATMMTLGILGLWGLRALISGMRNEIE